MLVYVLVVLFWTDHLGAARRFLILAGAVAVVYWVAKGSAAFVGHFVVAAQYMLFRICWAACVGPAGAGCTELLPGRLVLICEEGLVPPINTIVQKTSWPMLRQQMRR
jgi:hypothetical protein